MAIGTPTTLGTAVTPGATGSSLVLATSAVAPAGSLVIVCGLWGRDEAGFETGATVSGGSLTWTKDVDAQFSGAIPWQYDVFSAPVGGSDLASSTNLTLSVPAGTFGILMSACYVTGLDTGSSRVDVTDTNGASVTNWDTTATSTTVADTLVIGGSGHDGLQTNTATGGATELHDFQNSAPGWSMCSEYKILSSAASTSLTGTWTGSAADTVAAFVAYKAAAVAAAPSFPGGRIVPFRLARMRPFRAPWLPFPVPFIPEVAGVTYAKSGEMVIGSLLSGADVFEASETGALIVDTILSGADVAEHVESGSLFTTALLGGSRLREFAGRAGSLSPSSFLSGADAVTFSDTGSLLTTPLLAGTSTKEGAGKAGSLIAGTQLRGADASEHSRQNTLATFGFIAGADSAQRAETGSLVAGTTLAGTRTGIFNRLGSLLVRPFISGEVERQGLPAFIGRMGSLWRGRSSSRQTGETGSDQDGRMGVDT